jgi:DNA-binding GntR family transcriptional regulator
MRPEATVLSVTVEQADEIATMLDIEAQDQVTHIHRLRSLNDDPIIVENIFLAQSLFPGFKRYDLSQSLRDIMREHYDIEITHNQLVFESILSTEEVSSLLDIPVGFPMLLEKRVTYANNGSRCEYSEHIYPGDRFSFVLK